MRRCVGDCSCPSKTLTPYSECVSTQESWFWVIDSPPALCGTRHLFLVLTCGLCISLCLCTSAARVCGFHSCWRCLTHGPFSHTGTLVLPINSTLQHMKVPLVSARVFSGPLCKHRFIAACEDQSHAYSRPIAPSPHRPIVPSPHRPIAPQSNSFSKSVYLVFALG